MSSRWDDVVKRVVGPQKPGMIVWSHHWRNFRLITDVTADSLRQHVEVVCRHLGSATERRMHIAPPWISGGLSVVYDPSDMVENCDRLGEMDGAWFVESRMLYWRHGLGSHHDHDLYTGQCARTPTAAEIRDLVAELLFTSSERPSQELAKLFQRVHECSWDHAMLRCRMLVISLREYNAVVAIARSKSEAERREAASVLADAAP